MISATSAATATAVGGLVIVLGAVVQPRPPTRLPSGVGRSAARRRTVGARTHRASLDELIEVLDDVARSLRTGHSLVASLDRALRARPDVLAPCRRSLAAGHRLVDALDLGPRPGGDVALVVHALLLADRAGGPAADAVERTAAVLRERRAWRAERGAQAAQARLGATVMTLVPLGFALWSSVASARVRATYGASAIAVSLAGLGLVLNAAGWWWMRRITAGDER